MPQKATKVVTEELQRIYDRRGELTPQLVVTAARRPTSPLHGYLQWDDSEAAKRWRLYQASELIRSVKVTYREDDDGPHDLRAWINVRPEDGRGGQYRPVMDVAQDEFARTLVLTQMEREWKTMRERYNTFEEFIEMVKADIIGRVI